MRADGEGRQAISFKFPAPSTTLVRTSLVGFVPGIGVSAISVTAPAWDPLSAHRVIAPFDATPQPISSRLPLPLRTAVIMFDESMVVIVTQLTVPAWDPLSCNRESVPSVSNCQEISSRLSLPLRTAVTTIFAPTTAIAILLASPAEVPLSQIRVMEPMPAGTSHRIINKLLLPLRIAVIAVRSMSASATSPIAPACDPLSAILVTTVCAGGDSQPISSRFPERSAPP